MNQQFVKEVKDLVDEIICQVGIGELEKAKVLLETLKITITIPKC